MFQEANIDEIDLSNWNTNSLIDTSFMFLRCKTSRIDIRNWEIEGLEKCFAMFMSSKLQHLYLNLADYIGKGCEDMLSNTDANIHIGEFNETVINLLHIVCYLDNKALELYTTHIDYDIQSKDSPKYFVVEKENYLDTKRAISLLDYNDIGIILYKE